MSQRHLKKGVFFLVCVAVLGGLFLATIMMDAPVHFNDQNLEAAVRARLDHYGKPIFQSQLLNITELDLSNQRITDLEGMQYFRNLRNLNLSHNTISDLTPLALIKNLHELDLSYNAITNLDEANLGLLKDIPLTNLNISYNERSLEDRTRVVPSDISLLASFKSLENLKLAGNRVENVSPLKDLRSLRTLDLQNNLISDITSLQNLMHLDVLTLSGNQIQDISALEAMQTLRELDLNNNLIAEISALRNLPRLQALYLAHNPISDISVLGRISHLQVLDVSGICLQDFSFLQKLAELQNLNLRETCMTDLTPISNLENLSQLNLRGNRLTDLSHLLNLMDLRYLNLHSNEDIESIAPVGGLIRLKELILRNVPIGDQLNQLQNLKQLNRLNIRNCNISNLAPLEELMAYGALRDDPSNGIYASIDIRDNPLKESSAVYAPVRPYWHRIHIRYPLELPGYTLQAPDFSVIGGFFQTPVTLSLSTSAANAQIYYTTDGSAPTKDSNLYASPFLITSREDDPNNISMIPTNNKDWEAPEGEVFKATTIRARVIANDGREVSPIVTHTYFVDENIFSRYKMPIVSLVTNAAFLFDPMIGIYTPENAENRGEKWERPAHLAYFGVGGEPSYGKAADIRINGEWTRQYPQKSLRLYADVDYEEGNYFTFNFYNNENSEEGFDFLILRNAGQDWFGAFMRDAMVQNLAAQIGLDTQAQRPVLVFINGEYWGIHYLVESYNENYFTRHYGVDPKNLVVLEYEGIRRIGEEEDAANYQNMISELRAQDPKDEKTFESVSAWIDLANYIDYMALEIYSANWDWPTNNISYWRVKETEMSDGSGEVMDGRWRWLVQDLDASFSLVEYNSLDKATSDANYLLKWLLDNPDFRVRFINRFADQLNSVFMPTHVLAEINNYEATLDPEMEEHIRRWRYPFGNVENWYPEVDVLRNFAQSRPVIMRQMIVDHFDLPGVAQLRLQADQAQGYLQVNTLAVRDGTIGIESPEEWQGTYFMDIPVTITAHPMEGYQFSHWEGEGFTGETASTIVLNLDADLALQAVFSKVK